jgi:hypothetical protein
MPGGRTGHLAERGEVAVGVVELVGDLGLRRVDGEVLRGHAGGQGAGGGLKRSRLLDVREVKRSDMVWVEIAAVIFASAALMAKVCAGAGKGGRAIYIRHAHSVWKKVWARALWGCCKRLLTRAWR